MNEHYSSAMPTEVMARHYLIAAMWTEEENLKGCTELGATTQEDARNECARFLDLARSIIQLSAGKVENYGSHLDNDTEYPQFSQMGHDLWLTRNGHGTGFWDRKELCDVVLPDGSNLGEALSNVARSMGNQYLYANDDGLLYLE